MRARVRAEMTNHREWGSDEVKHDTMYWFSRACLCLFLFNLLIPILGIPLILDWSVHEAI